jgi:anti-sigma regulatory factor (Ser/Thr protein kinase)
MLIEVSEASQTGEARRKAVSYAEDLRMDESRCGAVAIVATEMASNLVKHAGRGHILVQPLHGSNAGLRIMSVDKGPGIADVPGALRDGHSTAGTMGSGLGAIRRLADSFDLYSVPAAGTVVCAEFRQSSGKQIARSALEVGVVSEPMAGEDVSGDGWGMRTSVDGILLMVVDGLGHGLLASEAAREAERVLFETQNTSPKDIIQNTHAALKKTRGAAEGIARIDIEKGLLSYVGVGNISATIVAPAASRSIASHNGILGQNAERVQEFTFPWNADNILVMHSDGLVSRWDLQRYAGIWNKPSSVIAAVLHRDFSRGRDDVTVLVAKAAS